jgi:Zn finger protein HypA/HybF involved in hydrogenase expression
MEINEGHCVKCRGRKTIKDAQLVEKKVKTSMKYFLQGKCPDCGTKIFKIMSKANAEVFKQSNPIQGGWQEIP